MPTVKQRLAALEQIVATAQILVLSVDDRPTPEQQGEIDKATRAGRRLVVFVSKGDTVWIPGAGVNPPWDEQGDGAYGNR